MPGRAAGRGGEARFVCRGSVENAPPSPGIYGNGECGGVGPAAGDGVNRRYKDMPEFITLDATKRTVIGKQVKQLRRQRSEEHTSELQSRPHLVCRLLLEKKK